MSSTTSVLRTLAFGDLDRTAWGAALMPGADGSALVTLGAVDAGTAAPTLRLTAGDADGEWRLDGEHGALIVEPAGDAVAVSAGDDHVEGFDQLCRVRGRFELDGADRAVDSLGLWTSRSGSFDLGKLESVRAVSTWFEPDEGLALVAFRPRKAKAHDNDVITATVLGPEGSAPVEDPRLTTTYDAGGWPIRAGLELWLAAESEEEQYPRRASGEAAGGRAQSTAGDLDVRAEPFRWHSRGRDGAGIYLLARRR